MAIERKINPEIRDYHEAVFMGLTLRQFAFSLAAVGAAAALYFLLKPVLGTETVSWVCMLGAAPFAALGFVRYQGMTAEKLLWAWLRTMVVEPKEYPCTTTTIYRKEN